MADRPAQDRNIAATFAKGMAVLEAFATEAETGLSLAEIARRTGQDRAAARRGALTLVNLGYLRRDGRHYRLSPRVLRLAGAFLQANRFGRLVQPVLNHHAAALGAEITLACRDGDGALLLAQSNAHSGPVTQGFTLGSRLPLWHTALGRMLLALEPPETMRALLQAARLPRPTPQALTDPAAIAAAIDTARAAGHALSDGEFEPGIVGLAVPVGPPGVQPVVAGSSTPRGTGDALHVEALLRGLQHCAAELRQAGGLSGF